MSNEINRSQMIRDYLIADPTLTVKQLRQIWNKEHRKIQVSDALFRAIINQHHKNQKINQAVATHPTVVTKKSDLKSDVRSDLFIYNLQELKWIVEQLGGKDNVVKILDLIS